MVDWHTEPGQRLMEAVQIGRMRSHMAHYMTPAKCKRPKKTTAGPAQARNAKPPPKIMTNPENKSSRLV